MIQSPRSPDSQMSARRREEKGDCIDHQSGNNAYNTISTIYIYIYIYMYEYMYIHICLTDIPKTISCQLCQRQTGN